MQILIEKVKDSLLSHDVLETLEPLAGQNVLTISMSIVSALNLTVLASSPLLSTDVKKEVRNWNPPRSMKLVTNSWVVSG